MATTTTTTTTTYMPTSITETVLIGTATGALVNIEYQTNGASVADLKDLGSPVASILYAEETNKAYVATNGNLSSYAINYYVGYHEIEILPSISNDNGSIFGTYNKSDNSLWTIQSYNGKVVRINPSTFEAIKEYGEFDAPFKIRYSPFHNAYFVAGSSILWKIDVTTDTVTSVYEINGYSLKDFDISENGVVCMLWRGQYNDIIRIVNGDLYTFALNKQIGAGTVAYCRYCKEGRFYILVEVNTGSNVYSAVHYVFDSSDNTLESISAQSSLLVTTTTTTPGTTTKAVQVKSPSGGESLQLGSQYDIQWISSKGITDFVKIELYKGDILYDTITDKVANTGTFSWDVASDIETGSDYKITITWLAASSDPNNSDSSASSFSILKSVVTTTTTTTTKIAEHAIGIDYSPASDQILIVLASGLYMVFVLPTMTSYGLLNLGVSNPSVMATRSMAIRGLDKQSKVRIFVGTEKYWSDKWDSGIIATDLKSMYYGGGNNLQPGAKYYAHIQVYSDKEGWGEIQIQEFVMPR